MTDQPSLFDSNRPEWAPVGETISDRWWAFHLRHPDVYAELVTRARRLVGRGYRHFGISVLWEALRYETMLGAVPGEEPYKLNDHYRSRYARLLVDTCPDLAAVFELRRLRSQDAA